MLIFRHGENDKRNYSCSKGAELVDLQFVRRCSVLCRLLRGGRWRILGHGFRCRYHPYVADKQPYVPNSRPRTTDRKQHDWYTAYDFRATGPPGLPLVAARFPAKRCSNKAISTRLPLNRTPSVCSRNLCSNPYSLGSEIRPPEPSTLCHGSPGTCCSTFDTWRAQRG